MRWVRLVGHWSVGPSKKNLYQPQPPKGSGFFLKSVDPPPGGGGYPQTFLGPAEGGGNFGKCLIFPFSSTPNFGALRDPPLPPGS